MLFDRLSDGREISFDALGIYSDEEWARRLFYAIGDVTDAPWSDVITECGAVLEARFRDAECAAKLERAFFLGRGKRGRAELRRKQMHDADAAKGCAILDELRKGVPSGR
jgi:hypothetical protein